VTGVDEFIDELRRFAPPGHARAARRPLQWWSVAGTGLAAVWHHRGWHVPLCRHGHRQVSMYLILPLSLLHLLHLLELFLLVHPILVLLLLFLLLCSPLMPFQSLLQHALACLGPLVLCLCLFDSYWSIELGLSYLFMLWCCSNAYWLLVLVLSCLFMLMCYTNAYWWPLL
jgi:hypothetical protein